MLLDRYTNVATVVFGLVGLLIVAVPVLLTEPDDTREITITQESAVDLAEIPSVEGLAASYLYFGDPVDTLWNIRVSIVNTGDRTIIGSGGRSDLIDDRLVITVPHGLVIVKFDIVLNQPNLEIEQLSESKISIKPGQWKKREEATVSVFVTPLIIESSAIDLPEIAVDPRQLIDGNISLQESSDVPKSISPDDRFLDRFISPVDSISRWLIGGFALLLIFSGTSQIGSSLAEYVRYSKNKRWIDNTHEQFNEFVSGLDISDPDVRQYTEDRLKYGSDLISEWADSVGMTAESDAESSK